MSIWNLTAANLRKNWGSALSLAMLILLSTLLLHVGLGIFVKVDPFFTERVEESQSAHGIVILQEKLYEPEQLAYLQQDSRVTSVEAEQVMYMGQASIGVGSQSMGVASLFMNLDQERDIAPVKLLQEAAVPAEKAVYVPVSLKNMGYELGDALDLSYLNKDFQFMVAGYFETTAFGTVNSGTLKFYVKEPAYQQLEKSIKDTAGSRMLSVRMVDPEQSSQLLRSFKEETGVRQSEESTFLNTNFMDYRSMAMVTTMMISIFAMLLVAFSWIIVIVALIVIRFRVVNTIEDQMVNMGVLGALGYTSRQIKASLILQFMVISAVGAGPGSLLSYVAQPAISDLLSSLSGLTWVSGFQPVIDLVSAVVVLLLVLGVTFAASRRISKLPPVIALRGGVHTHSFRRNAAPLDRGWGGLQLRLAMKNIGANLRQNVIVALIMAGVTFASVFTAIIHYNVAVDKGALYDMFGSEMSDIVISAQEGADSASLFTALAGKEGVVKANLLDVSPGFMDGLDLAVYVAEDFDSMENLSVYKGRMPLHDNEIVLTGVMSDNVGKTIGETVELEAGGNSGSFLITGLTQTMNNGGQVALMTLSGMHTLNPSYDIRSLHLYLDDPSRVDDVIDELKQDYAENIAQIQNYYELAEMQLSTYSSSISLLMTVVLIVTSLVVALIVYLVIHSLILKRKRDLGIYKAIGYTTFQLMVQTALSLLPAIVAGAVIGGLLAAWVSNPLLSLLLYNVGVSSAAFDVPVIVVMVLCAAVVGLAYVISLATSRRIRKVSAYELIVE
ncbi:ABC transporter permease [Paenibacillus lemnae]|uniref:ABC transporter permease n=1 Tax=Paenibacillus lemnae TaxID=1330551 RepID=A0A848M5N9_PAELE|nr:FtsX-like permease family protein [Paenibacillus lemnae]NMO96448.1 ABC transporter permease [Paenibacillus lemnae]